MDQVVILSQLEQEYLLHAIEAALPLQDARQFCLWTQGQFQALLQRAIGFAGGDAGRVLVLSFPDWGATPFGAGSGRDLAAIEIETDEFNAAAEVISTQQGVAFVDITDISRAQGEDPTMIAEDGLHPSARMYALWSARALPVAAHLLGGTD